MCGPDPYSWFNLLTDRPNLASHPHTYHQMFSHIGPDMYYTTTFSSSSAGAPLTYLNPDPTSCPTCCTDFAIRDGSATLRALIDSKTVFVEMNDLLVHCQMNTFIGLETLYLSLVHSGAKAIIHGALYGTPGLVSNLVSTSVDKVRPFASRLAIPSPVVLFRKRNRPFASRLAIPLPLVSPYLRPSSHSKY